MSISEFNKELLSDRLDRGKFVTESGCWIFSSPNKSSRREIYILDRNYKVTRVSAYIYLGLNLDNPNILVCHKCSEKNCWNPKHLYLGDTSSNTLDSVADGTFKNPNTNKTHCKNGHPLTGSNLYLYIATDGSVHRWCKRCRKLASAIYRATR